MRLKPTFLTALLAAAVFAAPATAAVRSDRLMASLAAEQTMGWKDNRTSADQLLARVRRGHRIYVSCSVISAIGILAAQQAGITARPVSVVTSDPFDGYNDGHAMLELRVGGRWVLYDLDLNRVAVDHHGRRIGLAQQAGAHPRRWRIIARDRTAWNYAGTTPKARSMVRPFERMTVDAWYDHVFGTALIGQNGKYLYHGGGRSPRIDAVWPGVYQWVDAATWRALNR